MQITTSTSGFIFIVWRFSAPFIAGEEGGLLWLILFLLDETYSSCLLHFSGTQFWQSDVMSIIDQRKVQLYTRVLLLPTGWISLRICIIISHSISIILARFLVHLVSNGKNVIFHLPRAKILSSSATSLFQVLFWLLFRFIHLAVFESKVLMTNHYLR